MTGGVYLWKDGREVPDTMNVVDGAPRRDAVHLGFGIRQQPARHHRRHPGTDGTISKGQQIRYTPQKVNRPDGTEMVGADQDAAATRTCRISSTASARGKRPNCPFDVGFRVSIACRMAVDSYRQGAPCAGTPRSRRNRLRSAVIDRGFRIHSRTDPAPQGRARIRRGGDPAARDGVGRGADLPAGDDQASWASSATWARSFPKSWAARASATSNTPSSLKSSRAWMARSGSSSPRTLRCARTTFIKTGDDAQRRRYLPKLASGRVDRLLVADRARSRLGRGGHAHHRPCARAIAGS